MKNIEAPTSTQGETPTANKQSMPIGSKVTCEQRSYRAHLPESDSHNHFVLTAGDLVAGKPAQANGQVHGIFQKGADLRAIAGVMNDLANDLDATNGVEPVEPEQVQMLKQPNFDLSKFGTVAVCSIGKNGVITGFKKLPWGWSYVGINVDNGERWASRNPLHLCDNLGEFIRRRVDQARASAERETVKA